MANGDVDVTEGAGLKVGTYTISEDAVTRHIQRAALNDSSGVEVAKAIDTATGATDKGLLLLGTRDDALTTLTPADGDNVQVRFDSTGAMWVRDTNSTSAGQTVKGSSTPVTVASDQEAVGYLARAHGATPDDVTAGDPVLLVANRHGIPFIIGGHPNSIAKSHRIASATSDMSLLSIATGLKAIITQIWVRADKANSGNTSVQIGFGAAATPTPTSAGTTGLIIDEDLGAGDGHQIGGGVAIVAVGGDFHDLFLTTENPTAGAITVGYTYYTIES